MLKWIIAILIVAGGGYVAYDGYKAGYHTRPAMPEGAFSLSYKNGLRAILVDVPDQKATRRYFGFPQEVPHYLRDVWSFCYPPTDEEGPQVRQFMQERNMPGERFEAVCKIKADDDIVLRGGDNLGSEVVAVHAVTQKHGLGFALSDSVFVGSRKRAAQRGGVDVVAIRDLAGRLAVLRQPALCLRDLLVR